MSFGDTFTPVHSSSVPGRDDLGADLDAEPVAQPALDLFADRVALGFRGARSTAETTSSSRFSSRMRADEVVALDPFHGHGDVAHGLGPDVDAAELDHVVAAPRERADAAQPAAALALAARVQVREVHDVVAELRAAGLVQLGDAQRAELAVGQRLARLGVDDLQDVRVLEDVEAVVHLALDRGPLHLVEAVRLVRRHAEHLLELLFVADVRQRVDLEVGRRVVALLAARPP